MKKYLIFLLILASCSPKPGSDKEISKWEKQAERVDIYRDNFGIAHIYGKTDADAVFGMLYAQCEDDFNRVEVNYINAMGRMAEVEGESEIFTDLRMQLYIDPEVVKKEYRNSPNWLRELMDAFADGINYYLHTHPEVKPKLLTRFEPWMALTFSEGSIGGDIERISTRQLGRFYTGDPALDIEDKEGDNEPGGSNGFAIAPKLTESGNAMLLINPHTSFFFRDEIHMVSEEGLNAYGAVTWGQFFIYQGFNEKCGWMHTSSRADAIDYYYETIIKKNGKLYYEYGDELRPVIEKNINLKYKDGDDISTREFRVYYTHNGPVIREENGKWISIRLMVEHEKALTQSYLRTKAKGHKEFKATMDIRTNSSNNTVYADADGNIAYYHGNFIPVRSKKFDWNGIVDGSNPETDWKGLHTVDEMIFIHNPDNGWIQNCNSTPFTACGENSPDPGNYPSYMAPDGENARGIHAVRVLQGQSGFTLDKLISTAYDSYLTYFEPLIPVLAEAFENAPAELKKSVSEAVGLLVNWDLRFSLRSVETSLAVYWGEQLGRSRGLGSQTLTALIRAMHELEDDWGTWKVPWGEINRYQRINGDIVQKFNDSLPSLPVAFTSSRWG
jgi:acyl-homoserine lactone acylase PvdQ